MNNFDSTPWLLEQWAWWARINHGLKLGFPNKTPEQRLLGTTARSPAITDLVAGEVDYAVAQLCQDEPQAGKALVMYYVRQLNYFQIGERLRLDRKQAAGLVESGVVKVGEVLDGE